MNWTNCGFKFITDNENIGKRKMFPGEKISNLRKVIGEVTPKKVASSCLTKSQFLKTVTFQIKKFLNVIYCKGSSINDIVILGGGRGQRFCDDKPTLVLKSLTMGRGVSKIA